ncbi:MAG: autotransporter-associated beta strand repeat-containing protein, partial [Rhabdochlamydiaceae bacterium]|nr:autotransporter-associated beta strand repeat-containing protein [Candidatus Amphrikana amoebophyrae]
MNRSRIFSLFLVVSTLLTSAAYAATISITNTNDAGVGSFRAAVTTGASNVGVATVAGTVTLTSGNVVVSADNSFNDNGQAFFIETSAANQLDLTTNTFTLVDSPLSAVGTTTNRIGVTGSAGGILFLNYGTSTTLNANIVSGVGLTKSGSSVAILEGVNTYTGATTISAGTLQFKEGQATVGSAGSAYTLLGTAILDVDEDNTIGRLISAASGTSVDISSTKTLTVGDATNSSYAGGFAGGGTLSKAGSSILELTGDSSGFTGAIAVTAGTLRLNNADALGSDNPVTLSGTSTLDVKETVTIGSLVGATGNKVAITTSKILSVSQASDGSFQGVISGAGGLTKLGGSVLHLTGANTYSGGTIVTAGTLKGDASSLQGNITDNATLEFAQGTVGTYSDVISGTGAVTKSSSGTLAITAAQTYTGATTVTGGILKISGSGDLSNSTDLALSSGATFDLDIAGTLAIDGISGAGNVTTSSASTLSVGNNNGGGTLSGIISGGAAFAKAGSGTVTLSGVNTFTGGTTLSAGTLSVAADNNLGGAGAITLDGGTLNISTGFTTSRNFTLSSTGTFNVDTSQTLTVSGTISGSGAYTKSGPGTLVLAGVSTYTGATTIAGGTVRISGVGSPSIATDLTINSGTTFDLNLAGTLSIDGIAGAGNVTTSSASTLSVGNNNASGTLTGIISGGGALTKAGTGTVTLGGVNTFTGDTTISAGGLVLNVTNALADTTAVTANGTLALNQSDTIKSLAGSGVFTVASGKTLTVSGT